MARKSLVVWAIILMTVLLTAMPQSLEVHAAAPPPSTPPRVVVHIVDQYGVAYNGVTVQVWQQSPSILESYGTTSNGTWISATLPENQTFIVEVYSQIQSANKTVYISTEDTAVYFTLERPIPPQLALTSVTVSPQQINPGGTFEVDFSVESVNNITAYSVFLNIQPQSTFTIRGSGSLIPVGTVIPGVIKDANASFGVQTTAAIGTYQIHYSLNYSDVFGNPYSSTGQFGVTISGSAIRPRLVAYSFNLVPSTVGPGSNFVLAVNVGNFGDAVAFDSTMSINTNSSITVVGSAGTLPIGTLDPGNISTFTIKMYANPSAITGSYPISFFISYYDKYGNSYNQTSTFSIVLSGIPKVIVKEFTPKINPLRPGVQTFLSIQLTNVGGDRAVDVSVVMSGTVGFLNNSTAYLGSISPGGNANSSFFLSVPDNAQVGSYQIALNITYYDSSGQLYTNSSSYILYVEPYSSPHVVVTNVLIDPPVLNLGAQGTMTIFLQNTGTTEADNILITFSGVSGILASNSFGVGTLAGSGQSTSVVGINVNGKLQPGNYLLVLHASYTDPAGNHYNSTFPMTIQIYPTVSIFTVTNIGLGAGLIVVALGVYIVIRRWHLI